MSDLVVPKLLVFNIIKLYDFNLLKNADWFYIESDGNIERIFFKATIIIIWQNVQKENLV